MLYLHRRLLAVTTSVALLGVMGCKAPSTAGGSSSLLDETVNPFEYTGHSMYRLTLINRPGPEFDVNQDLLRPTASEKYREDVGAVFWGAAARSLVPISGALTGARTGTEPDLMQSLTMMVTNAKASLEQELRPLVSQSRQHGPAISEAMIIPWLQAREDVFYDAEKISISPTEVVNVLGASASSDRFAEKLTEDIKALQAKLYRESDQPVYLLAARHFLFVSPNQTKLTVRVLLGLKKFETAFSKEDPRVKFSKIAIPDVEGEGAVASVMFEVGIGDNEPPKLHLEFGKFGKYEKGNFVIAEDGIAKAAPRLEGQANKPGTGWIALNFSFKKLTLNMRTAQLSSLNTLLSPGLRVGGSNFVVGGFGIQSIDQSFQTEINNTIDASIRDAIDNGNEEILDGMMKKEWLDEAFAIIFGRRGEAH